MKVNYRYFVSVIVLICFASGNLFAQNIHDPRTRFIIMSDRTGGECHGVFKGILSQAATLCPDFVLSIGDNIDGYTDDEAYLDSMWKEYDEMISIFDVPFIAIPGNHDIYDELSQQKWLDRNGWLYKAFEYGPDLFLLLDTEDGAPQNISDEQVEYFRSALESYGKSGHQSGWIYVLMHRPMWMFSGNRQYDEIKKMLEDYENVIVFSGHEHHYLKRNVEGRDYYMLATSGGGNELRNPSLGEFHHFFFVTREPSGPVISNILYDGIIDNDIVNQDNETVVNALREDDWITVHPVRLHDAFQKEIPVSISIEARTDVEMKIDYSLEDLNDHFFEPLNGTVVINDSQEVSEMILNRKGEDLSECRLPVLNFDVEAKLENDKIVSTHFSKPVFWDIEHHVDGKWMDVSYPYYIKEDWDWHGQDDCNYQFSLAKKKGALSVRVKITDDTCINAEDPRELQDKIFLSFAVDGKIKNLVVVNGKVYDSGYEEIRKASVSVEGNEMNILVPSAYLGIKDQFFFNIGYMDHDNVLNTKPSVLWWRPLLEEDLLAGRIFGSFVW